MPQSQQIFYPKTIYVYNKITYLAIALIGVVLLIDSWLSTNAIDKKKIESHFSEISYQFVDQASQGIKVFLANNERVLLPQYINSMAKTPLVKSIHLYDQSGQVIVSAVNTDSDVELSINDLYGLSPESINISSDYIPFVREIRTDALQGYVRITVDKSYVSGELLTTSDNRHTRFAMMIGIAFMVGFLLTKTFSGWRNQSKE
jgi:membrane protein